MGSFLDDRWFQARFWSHVTRGRRVKDCWQWTGSTLNTDYGRFSWRGRTLLAHRVAYELLVGPIPEGLTLDHLCRNRTCVSPFHLEAVSGRVNTLRSDSPSALNALKTECVNGHPYTEGNVYYAPKTGHRQCITCRNARKRTGRSSGHGTAASWARVRATGATAKQLRQWALANGLYVAKKGSIPAGVLDAYEQAHAVAA